MSTKVIILLTLMLSFLAYSLPVKLDFFSRIFFRKKENIHLAGTLVGYTSLEEICEHITYFKILEIYHITSGKNQ